MAKRKGEKRKQRDVLKSYVCVGKKKGKTEGKTKEEAKESTYKIHGQDLDMESWLEREREKEYTDIFSLKGKRESSFGLFKK